jgi:hypothetical protein
MSPRPDKYRDTDDDIQESYVDVEKPPKFKNSHTQKDPEVRCVIPESVWDHEKCSTE